MAYQAFQDIDGLAKVATLDEIRAHQANLSIPLYVRATTKGAGFGREAEKPLSVLIQEWEQSSQSLRKSMDELF